MKIDFKANSWIFLPENSDFPLQNIPFGIYKTRETEPHVCTRIGDTVIDLYELNHLGAFQELMIPDEVFKNPFLNDFIALGKTKTNAVRSIIATIFDIKNQDRKKWEKALIPIAKVITLIFIPVSNTLPM